MEKSHVAGWTLESPTPAQLKEFFAQVESGRITKERLQSFLRGERGDISTLLASWQDFYRDLFGLEVDFSDLQVPARKKGFDRLIIVAHGITSQGAYDKCQGLFPCWKWTDADLDKIVQSERTAKDGAYAVWFRNTVEADEDLENLSANDLKRKNIPGITLEERLIYELKYFKETGEHLDAENITLCAGSCCSAGRVPNVNWYDGKLKVNWYHPDDANDNLRSRQKFQKRNPEILGISLIERFQFFY